MGAAAFGALASTSAFAAQKPIRRFSDGRKGDRANEGYDATAYFAGAAAPGDPAVEHEWKGAIWRFKDDAARALFVDAPETYAPQFGGYCANAMSMKKVVPANPEVWRVRDGKLYLFAAKPGAVKFDKDPAAMIAKAQAFWKTLSFI
jgi:YHS domain-containing protein